MSECLYTSKVWVEIPLLHVHISSFCKVTKKKKKRERDVVTESCFYLVMCECVCVCVCDLPMKLSCEATWADTVLLLFIFFLVQGLSVCQSASCQKGKLIFGLDSPIIQMCLSVCLSLPLVSASTANKQNKKRNHSTGIISSSHIYIFINTYKSKVVFNSSSISIIIVKNNEEQHYFIKNQFLS